MLPVSTRKRAVSGNHSTATAQVRVKVWDALEDWPDSRARRKLLDMCATRDIGRLRAVGRALGKCGRHRREASEAFLQDYAQDRRHGVRAVVLYARTYAAEDNPRNFARELGRVASLPGTKPWPALMDGAYLMWARRPRHRIRLMTPWLMHRDPDRRCTALHGMELPAREDPRSALKVLRLFRGERHVKVRRLLGHVIGQSLYTRHPDVALDEMTRWLAEGAPSAVPVSRFTEKQVDAWFQSGMGSERQRLRLRRAAGHYLEDDDADVRAHARRLIRLLDAAESAV